LDWSIQRRAYDWVRRLIASVGRVYYRPRKGWDCTVKSDIHDILPCFKSNPVACIAAKYV